jgi:enoyl-CoA hydratase/carnithine racemase
MAEIKREKIGAIVVLTVSNEAKRNAFTKDMEESFSTLMRAAEVDENVRCIVVTGAGDIAFSSGHDFNEVSLADDGDGEKAFRLPTEIGKPVIAAINGHCWAAGLILAMSCDLRIASENATFGSPGAKLGMLPVGGQLGRLPRMFSHARAVEMLLTGEPMGAEEAHRLGFVSRLVPRGEALNAALDLASLVSRAAPEVTRSIKRGVIVGERFGVHAAEEFEIHASRQLKSLPAASEGVAAFLEKRPPNF